MPRLHTTIGYMAALTVASLSASAAAQESSKKLPPPEFSAEVGIGAEYDSNIAVEEIDRVSSESDYALTLDAELELEQSFSDDVEVALSYDYSQSIYKEFSQVDRQTHVFGADLEVEFEKADTGLSLYYINSRLDGDKFLELYRVSPSVSGFLSKKWFARGAYVYYEKTIESSSQRDADTQAGEGDLYYFRRGLRSYFNLGYQFKDEDAEADRYDYQSHNIKLRYVHRFDLFTKDARLELAWRYEDRDYSSITPSIGEERADERHRFRADVEIDVLKQGSILLYAGHGNYDSNFESADYNQNVFGTKFIYRW